MKHDQLVVLSVFRDMNCADFCVITPRGRLSVCVLKFFPNGLKGAVFSVDVCDEFGGIGNREVGQDFMLDFVDFIEKRIFKEFHAVEYGSIHSLEISWGSIGLSMVKYYGDQAGTFSQTRLCVPASFRVN